MLSRESQMRSSMSRSPRGSRSPCKLTKQDASPSSRRSRSYEAYDSNRRCRSRSPCRRSVDDDATQSKKRSASQSGEKRDEDRSRRDEHDKEVKPNNCLAVFGLSPDTAENDLREAFSEFGPIDNVNIVMDKLTNRSKGYAFVAMTYLESAMEAMGSVMEMEIKGKVVHINYSTTQGPRPSTPGTYLGFKIPKSRYPACRVLAVFGLSDDVTESDLHTLFSEYGSIESIRLVFNETTKSFKNLAFVTMERISHAIDAREKIVKHVLNGRRIFVEYSRTGTDRVPTRAEYLAENEGDYGPRTHRERERSPHRRDTSFERNEHSFYADQSRSRRYLNESPRHSRDNVGTSSRQDSYRRLWSPPYTHRDSHSPRYVRNVSSEHGRLPPPPGYPERPIRLPPPPADYQERFLSRSNYTGEYRPRDSYELVERPPPFHFIDENPTASRFVDENRTLARHADEGLTLPRSAREGHHPYYVDRSRSPVRYARDGLSPVRYAEVEPHPVRYAADRPLPVRYADEALVRYADNGLPPVRYAHDSSIPIHHAHNEPPSGHYARNRTPPIRHDHDSLPATRFVDKDPYSSRNGDWRPPTWDAADVGSPAHSTEQGPYRTSYAYSAHRSPARYVDKSQHPARYADERPPPVSYANEAPPPPKDVYETRPHSGHSVERPRLDGYERLPSRAYTHKSPPSISYSNERPPPSRNTSERPPHSSYVEKALPPGYAKEEPPLARHGNKRPTVVYAEEYLPPGYVNDRRPPARHERPPPAHERPPPVGYPEERLPPGYANDRRPPARHADERPPPVGYAEERLPPGYVNDRRPPARHAGERRLPLSKHADDTLPTSRYAIDGLPPPDHLSERLSHKKVVHEHHPQPGHDTTHARNHNEAQPHYRDHESQALSSSKDSRQSIHKESHSTRPAINDFNEHVSARKDPSNNRSLGYTTESISSKRDVSKERTETRRGRDSWTYSGRGLKYGGGGDYHRDETGNGNNHHHK